jgi:acyl carrier protein
MQVQMTADRNGGFTIPNSRELTVLDRTNFSAKDRVVNLVDQIFTRRSIDRTVSENDDLRECGLSSLDMVNLMLAVETEFNVKIPDKDMTPSNFRSVAKIHALVDTLRAA